MTFTFNENSLNLIREKLSAAFFKELEKNVDISTGEVIGKVPDIEKMTDDNAVATYAMRKFLERWRKQNSKGNFETWIGGKLHISVVDGDIPITAIYSGANVHGNLCYFSYRS